MVWDGDTCFLKIPFSDGAPAIFLPSESFLPSLLHLFLRTLSINVWLSHSFILIFVKNCFSPMASFGLELVNLSLCQYGMKECKIFCKLPQCISTRDKWTFPSVIWKGYFQIITSVGDPVHMGSQANQLKERLQAELPPPFSLHVFPWVGSHYKPTGKVQGQSHHVNSYRLTGSLGLEAGLKVRSLSQ